MKFHLLPVGTRFRYDDRLFTKNAPLTATDEQGSQRMIPRSAATEPVQESPVHPSEQTPVADLAVAAEDYHRQCADLLGQIADSLEPATADQIRTALTSARDDFLRRVEEVLGNR